VGYVVRSLDRTTAEMEAAGHPAIARIAAFGAAGDGAAAYYDTADALGFLVEAVEPPARMPPPDSSGRDAAILSRGVTSGAPQARLEDAGSGLARVSPGWFVVNVRDAAWVTNEAFGARCLFEADVPVLRERPELEPQRFRDLRDKLSVLVPGQPSGLYHADSAEEDFLVLRGECVARIEDEERRLGEWDFLHCAPGTHHGFVGAGVGPCVLLMVGSRAGDRTFDYPEQGAASAREAYDGYPHWRPGPRPDVFG
jgi:mannose-6-phosphate isomerase-like protein (cupin superfamily)